MVKVVEWLNVPLVPSIWKLYVPVTAEDATVIDMVELPGGTGLGEKLTCTPEGTPLLVERPTGEEKPPIPLMTMVAVVDLPCCMLALDGFTVIVKSCGEETCRSSSAECSMTTAAVLLPPDPVIVIG